MPTTIRCASRAASFDKAHVDDVVAFRVCLLHLFEKLGVDRMALFLQHIQREGDVAGGHLRAVEEARLGSEAETVVELVGRDPDGLGEQTVDRIGLVAVGGHQGVEGGGHAGRAVALPGVDVEGVEGVEVLVAARAGDLQRQQAAGRRLRIDVGEMREVGRAGRDRRTTTGHGSRSNRRQARRAGGRRAPRAWRARRFSTPPGGSGLWSSNCQPRGLARCIALKRTLPATAAKTRRLQNGRVAKRIKVRSSANGRAVPALAAAPRSTGDAALAFHPSDRLTSGYGDSRRQTRTRPRPRSGAPHDRPWRARRQLARTCGPRRAGTVRGRRQGQRLRGRPRRSCAGAVGGWRARFLRRPLERGGRGAPGPARGRDLRAQRPRNDCRPGGLRAPSASRRSSATKRSFGAGRRSLRGAAGPRPALCISTPA